MSQRAGAFEFRTEIEQAITVLEKAAKAKDAATIANLYAEDATLLPQAAPLIKGRPNIRQFWESFFAGGGSDVKIGVIEITPLGDIAYEIGRFEANMPSPGGSVRSQGKYVVIWKRQSDASIKMCVDIFNTNS